MFADHVAHPALGVLRKSHDEIRLVPRLAAREIDGPFAPLVTAGVIGHGTCPLARGGLVEAAATTLALIEAVSMSPRVTSLISPLSLHACVDCAFRLDSASRSIHPADDRS